MDAALDKIDSYYLGDGWYRDGAIENTDFYNAWAFHFYGLIYATLAAKEDPGCAMQFRQRARRFAIDWEARFDASGRVVPYGRSLTYRFGAAAFWGALAFAGEEALPWGQIRSLWTKHLRWWAKQPIGRPNGVLSIGWAYPDLLMSESYNGPGSPYWALKSFLPLALPADHPFWIAEERETGCEARRAVQRPAKALVNRDDEQAQLLNGGRGVWFMRQGSAKYGKFAYTSAFGFGVEPDDPLFADVGDSMLVLRDAAGERGVRAAVSDSGVDGDVLWSRWQPFPDVRVVTVLCCEAPWHARIHYVETGRALETSEGGFAIGVDDYPNGPGTVRDASGAVARVRTSRATSLIRDTGSARRASVHDLQPNTSLVFPRAIVPALRGSIAAGNHVLACVVAAVEAPKDLAANTLPPIPERAWQVLRGLVGKGLVTPRGKENAVAS